MVIPTNKEKLGIGAWISDYIHIKQCDVITDPCPNFKGGLIKPTLKLGHRWVIT